MYREDSGNGILDFRVQSGTCLAKVPRYLLICTIRPKMDEVSFGKYRMQAPVPATNPNKRVGSVNQYEAARAPSRPMFPTDSVSKVGIHCDIIHL